MALSVLLIISFLIAFKAKAKAGKVINGHSHDLLAHSLWSLNLSTNLYKVRWSVMYTFAFWLFLDKSTHLYKRVCVYLSVTRFPKRPDTRHKKRSRLY